MLLSQQILANDIESWFSKNIPARIQLSVLIRILIHSTNKDIREIDFPGNDDAERPGWDGWVQTMTGTAWVPVGMSGWEFGVSQDVKAKADGDFEKSVKATEAAERKDITFIFVTPRRWSGKKRWITEKKNLQEWKDIRAYDASDIEQWVEQSSYAKIWLLERTKPQFLGIKTLDFFWEKWTGKDHEEIYRALFEFFKKEHEEKIVSFLEGRSNRNLIVKSDSSMEALAFFRYVFSQPNFVKYKESSFVVDCPEVVEQVNLLGKENLLFSYKEDVERELSSCRDIRKIIIIPKNAICEGCDLTLGPISYRAFQQALEGVGKSQEDISEMSMRSGRSLTVLRRSLSQEPAVRKPVWVGDQKYASALVPFVLAGVWDVENDSDRSALGRLGNADFDVLEKNFRSLLSLEDSPVWLVARHQGVVSKIDSLFSIAYIFSKSDLDHFFEVAKDVLGESNPALELPEIQRYAAALYGKERKYSDELRKSLSETLILLSVHGKQLEFNGEERADHFVESILSPFTLQTLEDNMDELPFYAEAAPDRFLKLIERDLRRQSPEIFGLLKPIENTFLVACPRFGLLKALEGLAWDEKHFSQIINILGRLSQIEIDDNILNKPIKSLCNILCVFYPQTLVSYSMCIDAIKMLLNKYQHLGWKICLQQIDSGGRLIFFPNYRMIWRFGNSLSEGRFDPEEDIRPYVQQIVALMLRQPSYTADMICDLISKLHLLSTHDQGLAWSVIKKWRSECVSEEDVLRVREKIRLIFFSRYSRKITDEKEKTSLLENAREIYEIFSPEDIVDKYRYMFSDPYFYDFGEDSSTYDYDRHNILLYEARVKAIQSIFDEKGLPGIISLAEKGGYQEIIGRIIVYDIFKEIPDIAKIFAELINNVNKCVCNGLIRGVFSRLNDDLIAILWESLLHQGDFENLRRLSFLLPYRLSTWSLLDKTFPDDNEWYWGEVSPVYIFDSSHENNESVRRLLFVNRPGAIIASMHFSVSEIESSLIVETLERLVKCEGRDLENYTIYSYMIESFLRVMDLRCDISVEKKVELELFYLECPSLHREYRFRNIQNYIEEHPVFFVQMLVLFYKVNVPDGSGSIQSLPEGRKDLFLRAYRLFDIMKRIPGQNEETDIKKEEKLRTWVNEVKSICESLSCWEKAEYRIGEILSNASVGNDGVWPNEWVRNVMEEMYSEEVSQGAHLGKYNFRGVHWRGKGGEQERELSRTYREWGDKLQFSHPFVASSLLFEMAKRYEREAEREDAEEDLRNRL